MSDLSENIIDSDVIERPKKEVIFGVHEAPVSSGGRLLIIFIIFLFSLKMIPKYRMQLTGIPYKVSYIIFI